LVSLLIKFERGDLGEGFIARWGSYPTKMIITAHSLYKNNRKYNEDFNSQEVVEVE